MSNLGDCVRVLEGWQVISFWSVLKLVYCVKGLEEWQVIFFWSVLNLVDSVKGLKGWHEIFCFDTGLLYGIIWYGTVISHGQAITSQKDNDIPTTTTIDSFTFFPPPILSSSSPILSFKPFVFLSLVFFFLVLFLPCCVRVNTILFIKSVCSSERMISTPQLIRT